MEKELNELWENLVEYGIATEEELRLVTDINGYSIDTLNSVLYARTAYHNWEQFTEFEGVEE